jgi:hypothetical protein
MKKNNLPKETGKAIGSLIYGKVLKIVAGGK